MSRYSLVLLLLLGAVAPLQAQGPDTATDGPALRHRIERRFSERIREELDLTDEQAARLKEVAKQNGSRRRELRRRERALYAAIDQQLEAGPQADQDSVARMTREMLDLRVEYAQSLRGEMGKLTFLTPVQRARLMVMRDRLLHRVHEMRDDRRGYRHHGHGD
jgi:Spy/CpxP family protein refolding chaperone